jgi:uroporphyrinogen-III synthase
MRLIVTRPEPDATRTAKALIRLGHEAILSPMLDIEFEANARLPKSPFQALLVTSTNAVRALSAHADRARLAGIPLFAVGDHSALEAKRAGFSARSSGGDVAELAALVQSILAPAGGPLLYAAGEEQAVDLAGQLKTLGFEVETSIVYRARPRPRLADVAIEALRGGAADGILLYSRRSAAAFAQAVRMAGLSPLDRTVACFCLSAATAEPLPPVTSGQVLIADRPDQIRLFQLIERATRAKSDNGG